MSYRIFSESLTICCWLLWNCYLLLSFSSTTTYVHHLFSDLSLKNEIFLGKTFLTVSKIFLLPSHWSRHFSFLKSHNVLCDLWKKLRTWTLLSCSLNISILQPFHCTNSKNCLPFWSWTLLESLDLRSLIGILIKS